MRKKIKNILREKNEFEWIEDITSLTKAQISQPLEFLSDFGLFFHNIDKSRIINYIYEMGLNQTQLNTLKNALTYISDDIYEYGFDQGDEHGRDSGYNVGFNDGHEHGSDESLDALNDCEDTLEEKYDEGYKDSQEYSLNKFKEERKTIYNKAFEEGRAYESELDSEEFEKRQSGYDPRDYGGDYEN